MNFWFRTKFWHLPACLTWCRRVSWERDHLVRMKLSGIGFCSWNCVDQCGDCFEFQKHVIPTKTFWVFSIRFMALVAAFLLKWMLSSRFSFSGSHVCRGHWHQNSTHRLPPPWIYRDYCACTWQFLSICTTGYSLLFHPPCTFLSCNPVQIYRPRSCSHQQNLHNSRTVSICSTLMCHQFLGDFLSPCCLNLYSGLRQPKLGRHSIRALGGVFAGPKPI